MDLHRHTLRVREPLVSQRLITKIACFVVFSFSFIFASCKNVTQLPSTNGNVTEDFIIIYNLNLPNNEHLTDAPPIRNTHSVDETFDILQSPGNTEVPGYVFIGWNLKKNGDGSWYDPKDKHTKSLQLENDITLYAQWVPEETEFEIRYDYSTADISGLNLIPYGAGTTITLTPEPAEREGIEKYYFIAWNTQESGKGNSYTAGDTLTASRDLTLYAQWGRLYSIRYHNNNENVIDFIIPVDDTWYREGETVTVLSLITEKSEGTESQYIFGSWNTQADGNGISYINGQVITMGTEDINLYAQWERLYSVRYHNNNENVIDFNIPVDDTWYREGGRLTFPSLDTEYVDNLENKYVFTGWNTQSDGNGTSYINGQVITMGTKDIKLYAQWERLYRIKYHLNNEDVTNYMIPVDNTWYREGERITLLSLKRESLDDLESRHSFWGWNTQSNDGDFYRDDEEIAMGTEDIDLYAQWERLYRIKYHLNNEDVTNYIIPVDYHGYKPGESPTLLPLIMQGLETSEGQYIFLEWNTQSDGDGNSYENGEEITMGTEDINLHAQWERLYSVSYHNNNENVIGFIIPVDDKRYREKESLTLPSLPSLDTEYVDNSDNKYVFTGWNTQSDGNGNSYINGEEITMGTEDINLHAQWERLYSVSYHNNNENVIGFIIPVDDKRYREKESLTLPSLPSLDTEYVDNSDNKYVFTGWNTQSDGNGNSYINGQEITIGTEDINLHAQWERLYSVSYHINNDNLAFINIKTPVDDTWYRVGERPLLQSLNTEGIDFSGSSYVYSFMEWNTQADGRGTSYENGQEITIGTEDINLYAQYSRRPNLFSEGGGTSSDPFHVSNVCDLQLIKDHVDKHFILTNDISADDLQSCPKYAQAEFIPIGTKDNAFSGSFNGQGYKIKNLNIAGTCTSLFAEVSPSAMIYPNFSFVSSANGMESDSDVVAFCNSYSVASYISKNTLPDYFSAISGDMDHQSISVEEVFQDQQSLTRTLTDDDIPFEIGMEDTVLRYKSEKDFTDLLRYPENARDSSSAVYTYELPDTYVLVRVHGNDGQSVVGRIHIKPPVLPRYCEAQRDDDTITERLAKWRCWNHQPLIPELDRSTFTDGAEPVYIRNSEKVHYELAVEDEFNGDSLDSRIWGRTERSYGEIILDDGSVSRALKVEDGKVHLSYMNNVNHQQQFDMPSKGRFEYGYGYLEIKLNTFSRFDADIVGRTERGIAGIIAGGRFKARGVHGNSVPKWIRDAVTDNNIENIHYKGIENDIYESIFSQNQFWFVQHYDSKALYWFPNSPNAYSFTPGETIIIGYLWLPHCQRVFVASENAQSNRVSTHRRDRHVPSVPEAFHIGVYYPPNGHKMNRPSTMSIDYIRYYTVKEDVDMNTPSCDG